MTQEDKDLLFKDLCGRLPYGVKCHIGENKPYTLSSVSDDYDGTLVRFKEQKNGFNMEVYLSECKPYLFPMSEMTRKQLHEIKGILGNDCEIENDFIRIINSDRNTLSYQEINAVLNYCYKHNLDINGLILKCLAIDATSKNIY